MGHDMTGKAIDPAALARLIEQTSRTIHSRGHSQGLFPAQWTALRYFATAEPARRNASALAAYQGMAFGPVSRTVRTLITKGLLKKDPVIARGRFELLTLTEAGEALLAEDPIGGVVEALSELPEASRYQIAIALEAIMFRLTSVEKDRGLEP